MREHKAALSASQKEVEAARVFGLLERLAPFRGAQTVMLYWAMDDELPTAAFIDGCLGRRRIALPVVRGEDLQLREYTGRGCLERVPPFGIEEPQGTPLIPPSEVDLVLVPGVAFDPQGNRMGRGRGFYDRLFALMPGTPTIGLCLSVQLVERVPTEPHDQPMDMVICGSGQIFP